MALPLFAAVEYTDDGDPGARNEEIRWLLNRARHAPEREADRYNLVNSADRAYDVCEDADGANDFGTTPAEWAVWAARKPPLAPHRLINEACDKHSRDMAETLLVQHNSPSANYFPLNSAPMQRQTVQGYANGVSGFIENIVSGGSGSTGGYPAEAVAPARAHDLLVVDTGVASRGHRKMILNGNAREIGLGYYQRRLLQVIGGTSYLVTRDYYTQDVGLRAAWSFFTDTVFHDANQNGKYDQGEGVGGIEVRLAVNGVAGAWFDRSNPSGSFAVPFQDLAAGSTVVLTLVNASGAPRTITLPQGFATLGDVRLAAGEALEVGRFTRPAALANAGFRDVMIHLRVDVSASPSGLQLAFDANPGISYAIECADLSSPGAWQPVTSLVADEFRETVILPLGGGVPGCLAYRVSYLQD
ncbi:MAG: hypothetical protein U1G05_13730 [Kiritimatiellia bacterium]